MIAAGVEAATTIPVRTALQALAASPAQKRLLATRELVKAAREDTFPVSLEARGYFGVVSRAVLRLYSRLLESELVTFHELAAAAGNGALLTQTLRAVLADAPDIVTPYDLGASKRAKAYKQAWELWDEAPAGLIPGCGGPAHGPAVKFTPLALQRAHESEEAGRAKGGMSSPSASPPPPSPPAPSHSLPPLPPSLPRRPFRPPPVRRPVRPLQWSCASPTTTSPSRPATRTGMRTGRRSSGSSPSSRSCRLRRQREEAGRTGRRRGVRGSAGIAGGRGAHFCVCVCARVAV